MGGLGRPVVVGGGVFGTQSALASTPPESGSGQVQLMLSSTTCWPAWRIVPDGVLQLYPVETYSVRLSPCCLCVRVRE